MEFEIKMIHTLTNSVEIAKTQIDYFALLSMGYKVAKKQKPGFKMPEELL
jgi:hypothetical protein